MCHELFYVSVDIGVVGEWVGLQMQRPLLVLPIWLSSPPLCKCNDCNVDTLNQVLFRRQARDHRHERAFIPCLGLAGSLKCASLLDLHRFGSVSTNCRQAKQRHNAQASHRRVELWVQSAWA